MAVRATLSAWRPKLPLRSVSIRLSVYLFTDVPSSAQSRQDRDGFTTPANRVRLLGSIIFDVDGVSQLVSGCTPAALSAKGSPLKRDVLPYCLGVTQREVYMTADWLEALEGGDYRWEDRPLPAIEQDIAALAAFVGRPLPDDYVAFLRRHDGGSLWYRDVWYIHLWRAGDIP